MKDSEFRRFNYLNSSSDSKPMMMKLEGTQITLFAVSLFLSVAVFNVLFEMGASVLVSLVICAIFPLLTLAFVHAFMRGKPTGYFFHWVRSMSLKFSKESLLKLNNK